MAQSITSQSIGHHGHNHHPPQNLNPSHPKHHVQHTQSTHSNIVNNASSSSHTTHHKHTQENNEEAIARKKKNADAQAAFRQRRSTYIKSLEDTVTELKTAVTEMEGIVKTTSQEVKLHRQQVEYLQNKLAAYESGEHRPGLLEQGQHCKCCRFATQDFNPSSAKEHQPKSLPVASTSAVPINCDGPAPSIATSPNPTTQEGIRREWPPTRQGIPPIFQTGASSRSTAHHHPPQDSSSDPPHSTKHLDYPRHIIHQHSSSSLQNPSYQNLFTSFGPTDNSSLSHFYPVNEGNHAASVPHHPSSSGVCNSLELTHQPIHLQPVLGHTHDRSPPLRQPNSLGAKYSPLGPSQSFDAHNSGSLSSPRLWSSNHHDNHTSGPDPQSGAHLDGSPRSALYPINGSAADCGSSGFRMPNGISERPMMRSADYLPPLEHRPLAQSYPMIPTLVSPGAEASGGGSSSSFKHRPGVVKRRRDWSNDKPDSKHDTRETDDVPHSIKPSGVGKLNGLPAKVAQCAQVVFEVTKTVSHAKEECQSITASPSTSISVAHHSVSSNSTVKGYAESPDPSRDHSKFQRIKLNAPTHQLVSPVSALAPPHSQLHDEQQTDHSNHHRYHSLMGN